jgi:hypothetical protein
MGELVEEVADVPDWVPDERVAWLQPLRARPARRRENKIDVFIVD